MADLKDKVDEAADTIKDELKDEIEDVKSFMDKHGKVVAITIAVGTVLAIIGIVMKVVF